MSYDALRYDGVRQKSVHNSFQRREGVLDQLTYWRARSIEVDLHRSKPHEPDLAGDWYIFHESWDAQTSVDRLSRLLSLLAAVQVTEPHHEAITVFLDIKDQLDEADADPHSAAALDALLDEHLGAAIFAPNDLGGAGSLQDAVAGGWPLLRDLRGRFLFVLTGSTLHLNRYAADDASARARRAFVSRKVERADQIPGPSHVVIYNMDGANLALAANVRAHGLVSRAYYLDSKDRWRTARIVSCHHLATDCVNSAKDPWSSTSRADGWPFEVLGDEVAEVVEPGEVCGVWSKSGDVWGTKDSFYFHYRQCRAADASHTYDFLVSSPNSEIEPWAKACVMARASLRQDAAYFGVFRMGEKAALRVQFRDRAGAPTVRHELATPVGLEPDTLGMVRLQVTMGGRQCDGFASVDGRDWIHIARWDFAEPLVYQGIGVAGHDSSRGAKFLFALPGGARRPPFDSGRIIGPPAGCRGWSDWDGERRWWVKGWHK